MRCPDLADAWIEDTCGESWSIRKWPYSLIRAAREDVHERAAKSRRDIDTADHRSQLRIPRHDLIFGVVEVKRVRVCSIALRLLHDSPEHVFNGIVFARVQSAASFVPQISMFLNTRMANIATQQLFVHLQELPKPRYSPLERM